jgi:PKD repeat protein
VGDIMNGTGSGDGAPPRQFAWDFGDGATAGGMQAAHVYTTPGRYDVVLTVYDASGNIARDSTQVAISPRILPSMTSMVLISNAVAGQPVMFMATALDADSGALTYVWTFSDGQSAIGPQPVAIFPAPGTYLVSVSVTSDGGDRSFGEIAFDVVEAAP